MHYVFYHNTMHVYQHFSAKQHQFSDHLPGWEWWHLLRLFYVTLANGTNNDSMSCYRFTKYASGLYVNTVQIQYPALSKQLN